MQATRIQLALGNGTLADFTPQSQPHLWKAVQVSLIITTLLSDELAAQPDVKYQDQATLASGQCDIVYGPAKDAWKEPASPKPGVHAQISVGRLGVITEVEFRIIPQQLLTRGVTNITFTDFQKWAATAQDSYKTAVQSSDENAISTALQPLDRTQVCFKPLEKDLYMYAHPCLLQDL